MGVVVYVILAGYLPFHDKDQTRLFRKIKAGLYAFHSEYWANISDDAKVCAVVCILGRRVRVAVGGGEA